jgi:hypothetical protein
VTELVANQQTQTDAKGNASAANQQDFGDRHASLSHKHAPFASHEQYISAAFQISIFPVIHAV